MSHMCRDSVQGRFATLQGVECLDGQKLVLSRHSREKLGIVGRCLRGLLTARQEGKPHAESHGASSVSVLAVVDDQRQ